VPSVAFAPDGALLASGGADNSVRIWDVASGREVMRLVGDTPDRFENFSALRWLDASTLLAAGSNAIYRWSVADGRLLQKIAIPAGVDFIVAAAAARDGGQIFAVAQDAALYAWNGASSEWKQLAAPDGWRLWSAALSPDERLVAAATLDGAIGLWDVQQGTLMLTCDAAHLGATSLQFSGDGRYLAVIGRGALVLLGVP
jgi:WD40 repeat protein